MRLRYVIRRPALLRGAVVSVPRAWVDMERLRRELTVSNGAFWTAVQAGVSTEGVEAKLLLFREVGDCVEVPRHYRLPLNERGLRGVERQGGPFKMWTPGRVPRGVRHAIKLRNNVQRGASESLVTIDDDKILALGCGVGKTVVSLHAAAESLRLPLLVVVHTNALMGQWRDRIREHWRMKDGSIPRVGHIQQSKLDWRGYPVAVAMLHTLVQRRFDKEFYEYWRLVIFDETHRLGASFFSAAAQMFPGERWGLSATLKREDGMDKVIQLHLGKVAYEHLEQPLKPEVYFVWTDIAVNEAAYRFRRGRVNLSKLMSDLADHDGRNDLILQWLERAVLNGRTVLILGERLTQLHFLYENCSATSKAMHVGSMDQESRDAALKCQVVFATQHLAKEGLDRPAFDTLFILFPFGGEGRLRQSAGRILREFTAKKPPKIMIFEDNIGVMRRLAQKMRGHLDRLGFKHSDVGRRRR